VLLGGHFERFLKGSHLPPEFCAIAICLMTKSQEPSGDTSGDGRHTRQERQGTAIYRFGQQGLARVGASLGGTELAPAIVESSLVDFGFLGGVADSRGFYKTHQNIMDRQIVRRGLCRGLG